MAKQTVGEFLATLRRAHGFKQQEVADKLGVSNRTLSAWERDTSAPDVMLLPVLADLYGVTVDEILRGERRAQDEPKVSAKSEALILKRSLSRFTVQAYVLTGVMLLGLVLLFFGALYYSPFYYWDWWPLFFFMGLAAVIVCAAVLLALLCGAETGVDDAEERFGAYCLLLRGRFAGCCYLGAGFSALAASFAVIASVAVGEAFVLMMSAFLPFTAILYFPAWLLHRSALKRWGGLSPEKDGKLVLRLAVFGLIPALAAAALMIAFTYARPVTRHIIYQSDDITDFTEYMESLYINHVFFGVYDPAIGDFVFPDAEEENLPHVGDYMFPLSELAKTAVIGEGVDIGDGFTCTFYDDFSYCSISSTYRVNERTYFIFQRYTVSEDYAVYNVRYDYLREMPAPEGEEWGYGVIPKGNGMAFVRFNHRNFSNAFYIAGTALLFADAIACFVAYAIKKERGRATL